MSQRSKSSAASPSPKAVPANAVDEDRILDAAYQLLLAVGMRRMTMADIARRAEVSRATLYRRWPNVTAIVAELMTREWAKIAAASFDSEASTARRRLVDGVVAAVRRTRNHPMLRKIIEVDPEFLLPYLLQRRGHSTELQLDAIEHHIRAGQQDGSIGPGDPTWQARAVLLAAMSFALTGPVMATPDDTERLDEELRVMVDRYVSPA